MCIQVIIYMNMNKIDRSRQNNECWPNCLMKKELGEKVYISWNDWDISKECNLTSD